jgi:hypothetical protein
MADAEACRDEISALRAIYSDDAFAALAPDAAPSSTPPLSYRVTLRRSASDDNGEDAAGAAIAMDFTHTPGYPSSAPVSRLAVSNVRGVGGAVASAALTALEERLRRSADDAVGTVCVYNLSVEAVEWLSQWVDEHGVVDDAVVDADLDVDTNVDTNLEGGAEGEAASLADALGAVTLTETHHEEEEEKDEEEVGLAPFTAFIVVRQNTVQLTTAGMVHVNNLTPGSECSPKKRTKRMKAFGRLARTAAAAADASPTPSPTGATPSCARPTRAARARPPPRRRAQGGRGRTCPARAAPAAPPARLPPTCARLPRRRTRPEARGCFWATSTPPPRSTSSRTSPPWSARASPPAASPNARRSPARA